MKHGGRPPTRMTGDEVKNEEKGPREGGQCGERETALQKPTVMNIPGEMRKDVMNMKQEHDVNKKEHSHC